MDVGHVMDRLGVWVHSLGATRVLHSHPHITCPVARRPGKAKGLFCTHTPLLHSPLSVQAWQGFRPKLQTTLHAPP